MENLDQQAVALAKAIKATETGGQKDPYNTKGASGEFGAYQMLPATFKTYAKRYLGDANAKMSVENQNKVVYSFILDKKNQGYNPAQIASMWNAGEGRPDAYKQNFSGTNKQGVSFNVPDYVKKVSQAYQQTSGVTAQGGGGNTYLLPINKQVQNNVSQAQAPEKSPGFIERVANDWKNRISNVVDYFSGKAQGLASGKTDILAPAKTALYGVGQVAGGFNDVLGEGFKSILNGIGAATPQPIKESIKQGAISILDDPTVKQGLAFAQDNIDKYNEWAKQHPDSAKALESVVNIGAAYVGAKGLQQTGEALKPAISATKNAASAAKESIGNITGKATQTAKDVFTSGKQLKSVEAQLSEQPMVKHGLKNTIMEVRASSKSTLGDMTSSFKKANAKLSTQLQKEAQLQSESVKEPLRQLFRDMTTTYGTGLKKVEDALIKRKATISSDDYLHDVLSRTISEATSRGVPADSPALKVIQQTYDKLDQSVQLKLPISTIRDIKNTVWNTLDSGVRSGSQYSGVDGQVATIFLKNHGRLIADISPELKALNAEFAPIANARAWATKTFRPFNDSEIQRGANLLKKISAGEVPDKTAMEYITVLEKGSGRFSGLGEGALTGKVPQTGKTIRDLKSSFEMAKYDLVTQTDLKINNLRREIASLEARGIELGQKAQRLRDLKKLRNEIIGLTIAGIAGNKVIKVLSQVGQ